MEGTENTGHAKNQDLKSTVSFLGREEEALTASSLAVTLNHEYEVLREGRDPMLVLARKSF